jgi:hypothetical protein
MVSVNSVNIRGGVGQPVSVKCDFRIFLLHLGLIGDEFRSARKHLLNAMPGDAAWKNGRPKPKTPRPNTETSECCGAN